jgi:hypothetical protein
MQTVVHTKVFEAAAKRAGMTEAEIAALEDMPARDPEAGDVIQGSGGCRKVRIAGRGKGKSGGYRVITFYSSPRDPGLSAYRVLQGQEGQPQGRRS